MTINSFDTSYRNIWAVGDIHGCYNELDLLLQQIKFDPDQDLLLICGDLINRGPKNWQTLEYLKQLQSSVQFVWGNHDLFFLAQLNKFNILPAYAGIADTVTSKKSRLFDFVKQGKLLLDITVTGTNDIKRRFLITHAGIHPAWSTEQAIEYANFANQQLVSRLQYRQSNCWLKGNDANVSHLPEDDVDVKLRKIINVFTRMRLLDENNELVFNTQEISDTNIPWFDKKNTILQKDKHAYLLFGHWAAIGGVTNKKRIIGLDTGCVWGEKLTALNLRTMATVSQPSIPHHKLQHSRILSA